MCICHTSASAGYNRTRFSTIAQDHRDTALLGSMIANWLLHNLTAYCHLEKPKKYCNTNDIFEAI